MYIKVKVYADAGEDKVIQKSSDSFVVYTTTKPVQGAANRSVIILLASFLSMPPSEIRMIRGAHSTSKIFEII